MKFLCIAFPSSYGPNKPKFFFWYSSGTSSAEKKLLRKIDFFVLSHACLGYFAKWLEQANLSNAYVSGMKEDLQVSGPRILQPVYEQWFQEHQSELEFSRFVANFVEVEDQEDEATGIERICEIHKALCVQIPAFKNISFDFYTAKEYIPRNECTVPGTHGPDDAFILHPIFQSIVILASGDALGGSAGSDHIDTTLANAISFVMELEKINPAKTLQIT
ncbi:hypothetical protein B0J12DRAFT_782618 [Macrophomina phaseolina]|uniref:Uncharacterized protein n=1 Tax=Macrophomina phaseolina TaxID=35725 RepID=A0ABQ8GLM1_9PEZI|nr:hypothetical protein B0J12DRAFT_782618 [Macrophomina phaseolina]